MFSPAGNAPLAAVTLALLTVVLCTAPGKTAELRPGPRSAS